ncbi:hypothetical protein N9L68_09305 [bacterium]|nr:hypothetical protein [bacterium]
MAMIGQRLHQPLQPQRHMVAFRMMQMRWRTPDNMLHTHIPRTLSFFEYGVPSR